MPSVGGVIVTQDFLDTLRLNGPENTKLVGTVTAICTFLLDEPLSMANCGLKTILDASLVLLLPSPSERGWAGRKPFYSALPS